MPQSLPPSFLGKRVLDLGRGFGWHCAYALEHDAIATTGIDISEEMLAKARPQAGVLSIQYGCVPIGDYVW